jgi:hypothetical protein
MTSVITSPMTRMRGPGATRAAWLEFGVMVAARVQDWQLCPKAVLLVTVHGLGAHLRLCYGLRLPPIHLDWRRAEGNVLPHSFADHGRRRFKSIALGCALVAATFGLALMSPAPKAVATPNFARQTGRNCNFCHSGVPRLNDAGLAFKNNGFRFPGSDRPSEPDRQDAPAQ